ncbi:hypothetical protein ACU6ZN_00285 [Klebsiella aerogenes]|uniref:hypothetical protein n=1 Tax=Klebsiella aerogenes TaxID=548 RepID=UPI002A7FE5E5|nr:hypothetical protein [Klebsiella aerogenes]WPO51311.1 hypothetical protein SH589_17215 [Klebsiella aerogenes]WPS02215.1 hypothetical protein SM908_16910 [Klebsiella aerogenes]HCD5422578.1 hypothetical protein [Klebsiella aerogenes]
MKFRTLSKWDSPDNCKALIFFAQLLDEMLFDYTLDTYKPSVMNTPTLGVETLNTIKDVDAGIIQPKNVDHLIAELIHNLSNDMVAQSLLGEAYTAFLNKLKNPTLGAKERKSIIEMIVIQLPPKLYKEKSEELILQEIMSDDWTRSAIRRLTRNYISLLLYIGFSQNNLKNLTQKFFYYGENRITNNSDAKVFMDSIKLETKKHKVYFIVEPVFLGAEPTFRRLSLAKEENPPEDLADNHFFRNLQRKKIISVSDIDALDSYSARERAENYLKLASSFLNIYHHKDKPTWSNEALVISEFNSLKVSERLNPMKKCKDLKHEKAQKRLESLMSEFSLDNSSFAKFLRSIQLHSMALKSESVENQLLNLWIALESLVPSETKSNDQATIEHITDSIIPFLNIIYIDSLIENLARDLLLWNRHTLNTHFRGIPGTKSKHKLANIMILPEYEATRDSLSSKFRDYSLLSDRFEHIKNMVSTPESIKSTLDNHKLRLEWQFRRIYRTRNNIVHSGKGQQFTPLLVEHTHNYLDKIFEILVFLASKPQKIRSVTQGFRYIKIIYGQRYDTITKKGFTFNIDNIKANLLWD